jgi:hypothetical protein
MKLITGPLRTLADLAVVALTAVALGLFALWVAGRRR